MSGSASVEAVLKQMKQVLSRLAVLEARMTRLEESVQSTRAGAPGPKAEELLHPSRAANGDSTAPRSLTEAVERGDAEALVRLLEAGGDLEQRDARGDTALHLAAARGAWAVTVLLLGFGADVDARGQRLRTPLHCAASAGHLRVVRCLADAHTDLQEQDIDGATAVELAADQGRTNVVQMLLKKGALKDEPDGENALMDRAAKRGQWEVVLMLLIRGGCQLPVVKGSSFESALPLAVKQDHVEIVRNFLEIHQLPLLLDGQDVAWILSAARSARMVWAFAEYFAEMVRGEAGRRAVLQAARDGRAEVVEALLQAGADGDAADESGDTALHRAARAGHAAAVRALLAGGAAPARRNAAGKTPLQEARAEEVLQAFAQHTAATHGGVAPARRASSGSGM